MNEINIQGLADMLTKCHNNSNYQVGILFTDKQRQADFMQAMRINSKGNPWSVNIRNGAVNFRNGSKIEIIASKNCRGKRFHTILFDGNISDEALRFIYEPMLIPYAPDQIIEEDEADESLNNFLDEFTITQ